MDLAAAAGDSTLPPLVLAEFRDYLRCGRWRSPHGGYLCPPH